MLLPTVFRSVEEDYAHLKTARYIMKNTRGINTTTTTITATNAQSNYNTQCGRRRGNARRRPSSSTVSTSERRLSTQAYSLT